MNKGLEYQASREPLSQTVKELNRALQSTAEGGGEVFKGKLCYLSISLTTLKKSLFSPRVGIPIFDLNEIKGQISRHST